MFFIIWLNSIFVATNGVEYNTYSPISVFSEVGLFLIQWVYNMVKFDYFCVVLKRDIHIK